MENENLMTADTVDVAEKPKHKWLAKSSRFAKKAILAATTMSAMSAMCTTQAFAATGVVDTSSFISTACTVLKSVICLIGGGVGLWGVVNLLEGYGNDNPGAKCEDVDQQALSYSEIKALCTGDERIKEKMMLENEVKELNLLKSEHTNTVFDMQQKVTAYPEKHAQLETTLANLRADREILRQLPIDAETKLPVFKISIDGTEYTDKKEAAKALEDTVMGFIKKSSDTTAEIGEFQGFKLTVTAIMIGSQPDISITMENNAKHSCTLTSNFPANLKRMESTLYKIDQRIDNVRNEITKLDADFKNAEKIVNTPFPQQETLDTKTERLSTLTDELNKAAAEAKRNKPQQERTCYFERAKLKREAFKDKPKSEQAKEIDKQKKVR